MNPIFWLSRREWLSRDALASLQARKLRALVEHAYRNVPFYRRRFDEAGLRPDDIRTPADLVRLPYVTRQDLASRPVEDVTAGSVNLAWCRKTWTSGSLGMPLTIYLRRRDRLMHDLIWSRARIANGQRLTDRVVALREPGREEPPRWFQRLGLWRKIHMTCLDDADVARLDRLVALQPDVLVAYPSGLKLLARIMERERRRVRPRCLFTTSELLTEGDRREIETAFGVPVRDFYGAHETGLIAWQCPEEGNYHINTDSVLVEWEWDGKPVAPGNRGRVVCTVLDSFAMPFIRYVIGDVGVARAEQCPCGRGLPLMRMVEGREADFVTLPGGVLLSPDALCGVIGAIPGVRQFQVVQNADRSIEARVQGDAASRPAVAAALEKALGARVPVTVSLSGAPIWTGLGKYRAVVSHAAGGPVK